jgi:nucleotide-binding universal stress UspA family protein
MFHHILVPTDLTERSLKALDVALGMTTPDGGQITLLHVIETIEDADVDEFGDFYRQLENRAREKMEQVALKVLEHQPVIRKEIIYGKRVIEIVRFAEDRGVDLIVLSSHRVERESGPHAWGTISYKVGILSHCPVMLVK